ncbi:PEP-CTERM/exosortase system-associated acyltransferase [Govanella unica]|uniref:PEP-CTERM/exosortase system-associated acyltransferase n=1 Tax=Govanella unica TaxID=2975056 RepID=A0A9X3TXI9_9PROT|nr:PEP-CTERM/exosortase system-associated acyltransferase [Govania unica]MDA5193573.1 PEP-CTERM/exosortase system-associated acyltransferase [Govania unica]
MVFGAQTSNGQDVSQNNDVKSLLSGQASYLEEGQKLVDLYRKWFDVIPARTDDLVRLSQELRYQVYCVETGFENIDEFPDGFETDACDEHAVCSLLIHKPTGMVAGTVRLILPTATASLPVLNVSPELSTMGNAELPRELTGEISRFAISKQFRKRREDTLIPALYDTSDPGHDQRVIPHITLGLMQAILSMSIENGISHLAIMVEPALDRLIRKLGIIFTPVGPLINYHGKRRVHMREIGSLLDDVFARRPEIWEVLTNSGNLWPAPPDRT